MWSSICTTSLVLGIRGSSPLEKACSAIDGDANIKHGNVKVLMRLWPVVMMLWAGL